MLSGMINMGADVIFHHVNSIFSSWQSTSMNILHGVSQQSHSHNLLCLESMLNSVVSFLKFCPSLLLSVPDALNRVTSLLENIFALVSSGGRLQNEGETSIGNARLSNVRSAVMEAYSWLPPGSFPLSADQVFTFAAKQIQVRFNVMLVQHQVYLLIYNSFRYHTGTQWERSHLLYFE